MEKLIYIYIDVLIPFYKQEDFWISIIIGIIGIGLTTIGLIYSVKAFSQAREAKNEAIAAKDAAALMGKHVKISSIAIDLYEICQFIEKLDYGVKYSQAREDFSFITRKLNRLLTIFDGDENFTQLITEIHQTLDNIRTSLDGVRPIGDAANGDEHAVYYAIESHFTLLTGQISKLTGHCENIVIEQ